MCREADEQQARNALYKGSSLEEKAEEERDSCNLLAHHQHHVTKGEEKLKGRGVVA